MPDRIKAHRRDAEYAEKLFQWVSLRPLRLGGDALKAEPTAESVQEPDRHHDIDFCPIPIFRSGKGIRFKALHGSAVTPFSDRSGRRHDNGPSA
jgi:hypothetical protein